MNYNFIAVDFETATTDRFACQIGIVVVKDGIITERISHLIKPPFNKYDKETITKHHITPDKTENSPTFEDLWTEISHYFIGTTIFAHNASFDEDTLYKNLNYYCIMPMGIRKFKCTCLAFRNTGLQALCVGFGIEYDPHKHHDALYDAECCALFALRLYNNESPDYNKISSFKATKSPKKKTEIKRHSSLKGDVLIKDLSNADESNPFYDRKVVITGEFEMSRNSLASKLKNLGADLNNSISKNTNYVLIGRDPGPSKLDKIEKLIHDGYNIKKLYENDILSILNGNWDNYYAEKEIKKELDFTIDHYDKHHLLFENGRNIIASKNLYFGKHLVGKLDLISQIAGNLGAFCDNLIYPETHICVLSDSTLISLKNGVKDDTINYIQDYYNSNKSIVFNFKFISEEEFLRYCKLRCDNFKDDITLELYNKYMVEDGY